MSVQSRVIFLEAECKRLTERADQAEARRAAMRETLSEVLAVFRDEDVVVTDEMKERWLKVLERTTDVSTQS